MFAPLKMVASCSPLYSEGGGMRFLCFLRLRRAGGGEEGKGEPYAWQRGIERRGSAGRSPPSFLSLVVLYPLEPR